MNLAPEILKMRDALLERISGKSLKEVAEIVNEILLNETNNINRLAALSARVQILRDFNKKEFNKESNFKLNKINNEQNEAEPEKDIKAQSNSTNESLNKDDESWVRVEMLKSGIVNGVRFPEGVVIDVSKKDANSLEKQNLAKIIETIDDDKKIETTKETNKDDKGAPINIEDSNLEAVKFQEPGKTSATNDIKNIKEISANLVEAETETNNDDKNQEAVSADPVEAETETKNEYKNQ